MWPNARSITPIACSEEAIGVVLQAFPGRLQNFPTSNLLGVPLAPTALRRADEQAIVDRVAARIPTWKAGLLNAAGRTTLTKTTLSAIPIHVAICCTLSASAISAIDKCRRGFIWAGTSSAAGGKCKLSWPVVCSPKELGGLGVVDLKLLGFALRLRWEWLRRTAPDSPWAALPAKPEVAVSSMFRAATSVVLGDGRLVRFWTDVWLPAGALCHVAPALFESVARPRRSRSVQEALLHRQWCRDILGATTSAFISQFLRVWSLVDGLELDPSTPDKI